MKTIENLLSSGNVFSVDPSACMLHAEILRGFVEKPAVHAWTTQPKAEQLLFKIAFISICHQFNWDFLQNVLAENLFGRSDNIASILGNVTAPIVSEWLAEYPKKERIRAKERARLLRDIAKTIESDFDSDSKLLYSQCANAKIADFRKLMDRFEGYRTDPLRKKTNVLSHDLVREGIVRFIDPENIEPAIDYHIMRVYLRTGRVVPADEAVFRFLEGAPKPRGTLVRELRKTTGEAAKLTAFYAGINIADLNFVEWQIGRGICHNDAPNCDSMSPSDDVAESVRNLSQGGCPYRRVCLSKNQLPDFMKFEEPDYVSTNY